MKGRILSLALGIAAYGITPLTWSPEARAMTVEDESRVFDSYALEKQGDVTGAIKKMTNVLERNGDDYVVNLRLGYLFSLAKKYKNAIDHYEKALALSPTSVEPLLGLSLIHATVGNSAAAETACRQLLERDPKNYFGLSRLISAEIKMQHFGPALERAEAAAKLYPTDPVFLEQQGYIQMQLGKTAEARKTLGSLLLVSPVNEYARSILGQALAH